MSVINLVHQIHFAEIDHAELKRPDYPAYHAYHSGFFIYALTVFANSIGLD